MRWRRAAPPPPLPLPFPKLRSSCSPPGGLEQLLGNFGKGRGRGGGRMSLWHRMLQGLMAIFLVLRSSSASVPSSVPQSPCVCHSLFPLSSISPSLHPLAHSLLSDSTSPQARSATFTSCKVGTPPWEGSSLLCQSLFEMFILCPCCSFQQAPWPNG